MQVVGACRQRHHDPAVARPPRRRRARPRLAARHARRSSSRTASRSSPSRATPISAGCAAPARLVAGAAGRRPPHLSRHRRGGRAAAVDASGGRGADAARRAPDLERPALRLKLMADRLGRCSSCSWRPPVLLGIAVMVKRDTPGPVFFRQKRVGEGGRSSGCSSSAPWSRMPSSAWRPRDHGSRRQRRCCSRCAPTLGSPGSGPCCAASRIDELPQLFNVLRGEMSLVGPRPPLRREVDTYEPRRRAPTAGPSGDDRPVAGLRPQRPLWERLGPPRPLVRRQLVARTGPPDPGPHRAARCIGGTRSVSDGRRERGRTPASWLRITPLRATWRTRPESCCCCLRAGWAGDAARLEASGRPPGHTSS